MRGQTGVRSWSTITTRMFGASRGGGVERTRAIVAELLAAGDDEPQPASVEATAPPPVSSAPAPRPRFTNVRLSSLSGSGGDRRSGSLS